MDEKIQKVLEEKIRESTSKINEITSLVNSLGKAENPNAFGRGIIIGRLYNSFYYQSRRILKRNPTEQEFSEFIQLLKNMKMNYLEILFLSLAVQLELLVFQVVLHMLLLEPF